MVMHTRKSAKHKPQVAKQRLKEVKNENNGISTVGQLRNALPLLPSPHVALWYCPATYPPLQSGHLSSPYRMLPLPAQPSAQSCLQQQLYAVNALVLIFRMFTVNDLHVTFYMRPLRNISGSNPAEGMDVCLLCVSCRHRWHEYFTLFILFLINADIRSLCSKHMSHTFPCKRTHITYTFPSYQTHMHFTFLRIIK
jgi:hypothetical protein